MSDRPLQAPWLQGGGGGVNPLGMASDLMNLQVRQQELRTAQQGFIARQNFGQIMAAAPDAETGLRNWEASGYAGFAPELANQVRTAAMLGAQKTQIEAEAARARAETQLTGVRTGTAETEATAKKFALSGDLYSGALHVGLNSPTADAYETNWNGFTGLLPQEIKNDPEKMRLLEQVHEARMHNVPPPGDPGRDTAYTKNWIAGNGTMATPDQWHGMIGTPTKIATTGGEIGVLQDPTGAFHYPPGQTTLPGRLPPTGAGEAPLAGDGKVLYDTSMVDPRYATGAVPMGPMGPIITKGDADTNEDLRKQFVGELAPFRASQNVRGELANMDREVEHLAGTGEGGLLTPGMGMPQRAAIAQGINTFYQAFGKAPPFDPMNVAASEGLFKSAQRLAFQFRDQVEGHARPAVQELIQAGQAVPGAENTYLGTKLLIASVKAAADRVADERNFVDWWRGQHNGLYLGAYEAFDKMHPAENYSKQVFNQFGLTDNGKYPPGDAGIATVRRLVGQGLLTTEQAKSIFRSQFGATE